VSRMEQVPPRRDSTVTDTAARFVVEDPEWLRTLEREERRDRWKALPFAYFSWAQARQMLLCPACFEAKYINHEKAPKAVNMIRGAMIAAGVAAARRGYRAWAQLPRSERSGGGATSSPLLRSDEIEAEAEATWEAEIEGRRRDAPDDPLPPEAPQIDFSGVISERFLSERAKAKALGRVKDQGFAMLRTCIEEVVVHEPHGRYQAIEALVDFHDVFEFEMVGFLDLAYRDRKGKLIVRDEKTSNRMRKPDAIKDWLTGVQIALYGTPFYEAGDPWEGELLRIASTGLVKDGKRGVPVTQMWRVKSSPAAMATVKSIIVGAAEQVMSGAFPPRPSRMCGYPHVLPKFVTVSKRASPTNAGTEVLRTPVDTTTGRVSPVDENQLTLPT
jgi:hypothetical protein